MNKAIVIAMAGGARKLAELLGLSVQAISKWDEVPELRMYQLRELRPDWFREPTSEEVREALAPLVSMQLQNLSQRTGVPLSALRRMRSGETRRIDVDHARVVVVTLAQEAIR